MIQPWFGGVIGGVLHLSAKPIHCMFHIVKIDISVDLLVICMSERLSSRWIILGFFLFLASDVVSVYRNSCDIRFSGMRSSARLLRQNLFMLLGANGSPNESATTGVSLVCSSPNSVSWARWCSFHLGKNGTRKAKRYQYEGSVLVPGTSVSAPMRSI